MDKRTELREKALKDLQQSEVLMIDGHFDYGNGYHGRVYLNPHQLFRHPSTIWRFAQDLLDVMPGELVQRTEVVAGPVTGGALLAHTIAGLLDSRRSLTHPPCSFAPFNYDGAGGFALRAFYRQELKGKRVLLADDVRNTGRDVRALRGAGEGRRRHRRRDRRDLRSVRGQRRSRRAEHRARPAPRIKRPSRGSERRGSFKAIARVHGEDASHRRPDSLNQCGSFCGIVITSPVVRWRVCPPSNASKRDASGPFLAPTKAPRHERASPATMMKTCRFSRLQPHLHSTLGRNTGRL